MKRFTELRAWQLANQLKVLVYGFTDVSRGNVDRRFCEDTRAAIDSVTANVAEGFGRFDHKEFAHFLKIARSSLLETQSYLFDARTRNYVTNSAFEEMWEISERAMGAVTALYTYVRSHPTPERRPRTKREDEI